MTNPDLLHQLDLADEAFLVDMTRRTPGGQVVRREGLLLAVGADPSPVIVNTILAVAPRVELEPIERAAEWYRALGHGVAVWTRDHLDAELEAGLASVGYQTMITLPGMILEQPLPPAAPPAGITVRRVEADADLERWVTANLTGFASDDDDRGAVRSAFSTLDGLVGGPIAGFVAEADGRPVGASMVFVDEPTGIGVVGWVGTVPEYRRRGIGDAVTRAATNAGFALGARLVSLQASPMGLPLYEKLGYRTVAGYKIWFRPTAKG
ncbi:MAG TPA: GNAT family N-acetyltransferase [Candidatus Limnocylindrales bacterium]|nr:GNAT family N-acetyltransferase [Candidatus Limnocylindrales bacterium]